MCTLHDEGDVEQLLALPENSYMFLKEHWHVTDPPLGEHSVSATRMQREFFIDNLLVRIHLIIEMILVDRPCATGVCIPFSR